MTVPEKCPICFKNNDKKLGNKVLICHDKLHSYLYRQYVEGDIVCRYNIWNGCESSPTYYIAMDSDTELMIDDGNLFFKQEQPFETDPQLYSIEAIQNFLLLQ